MMIVQIFMSHTQKDTKFCTNFDVVAARVGIKVFRSELEDIGTPAWITIKQEMEKSTAMFLLVGTQLVLNQELAGKSMEAQNSWKYTQNWISYEVGLANQLGIDVWVLCDNVKINFPVPYLNNYDIRGIDLENKNFWWLRERLEKYQKGNSYPLGWNPDFEFTCLNASCGAVFNLHSPIMKGDLLVCPTCLEQYTLDFGWLV